MTTLSFSAALLAGGTIDPHGPRQGPFAGARIPISSLATAMARLGRIAAGGNPLVRPRRAQELPEDIRVVPDALPSAGPLAGRSACLDVLRSDLLVVLAVDLPQMTFALLRSHAAFSCSTGCGAVVQRGDFFEPLAAVYPRQARDLASDHLRQGRLAMQDLVREAIKQDFLQVISRSQRKRCPSVQEPEPPGGRAGLSSPRGRLMRGQRDFHQRVRKAKASPR